MNKKWMISLILALTLFLSIGGAALASEEAPEPRPLTDHPAHRRGVRGEITAVRPDRDAFDLLTRRGEALTFLVDRVTRFGGRVSDLMDLEPGMQAAVGVVVHENGELLARVVFIPPERPRIKRYAGQVTGVDSQGNRLHIQTRNQGEVTLQVNEETRFRGAVRSLEEIEIGLPVLAAGRVTDSGDIAAVLIAIPERLPNHRFAGEILAVDVAEGNFTLRTVREVEWVFLVDDTTQFHSRQGSIKGLEDLQPGMRVAVGSSSPVSPDAAAPLLASHVLVAQDPRGQPALRAGGRLIDIFEQSFTMETLDGRQLTIQVDEGTRFVNGDGQVQGLADLEPGMEIGTAATEDPSGNFLAKVVVVLGPGEN